MKIAGFDEKVKKLLLRCDLLIFEWNLLIDIIDMIDIIDVIDIIDMIDIVDMSDILIWSISLIWFIGQHD